MTRENVRNARKTEYGVLDTSEIYNSSSGDVMFTIAEKFSSFLQQKDKIGDLEKAKFVQLYIRLSRSIKEAAKCAWGSSVMES